MSSSKNANRLSSSLVEIKSKFDAEFRRFSIEKHKLNNLESFREQLQELHKLSSVAFILTYIDPKDGCLLPITNNENFKRAIETSRPTLKIIIQRKGESLENLPNGASSNKLPSILSPFVTSQSKNKLSISYPQDFRQVAAIIDVDVVPEVCRRVRLLKHGSDKPLGFYIRDGTSVRVTAKGLERVPGIYISRLVPGGLAESTGLLAVNDEVIEVNGIEVQGKTLDQVTDMMVANSSNLIITVKPANQRTLTHGPNRGSFSRNSAMSSSSQQSQHSANSDEDNFDQDEIRDLTQPSPAPVLPSQDEGVLHL
ncbi:Partitioning defective protein 6 [Armadillidium nasatum]|uniref:Partitioning defective protein 6 n=1 Tax=Armadillidium nasatum TaxID=96803 RepID=A0A5N5TGN1_9CRUS|nr:Partitioning defective protein 6 [Armadillidium nasatum]